jgi:superfamily I DNA/RNA helicase
MTSDDMKVSKGLEFPVVALPGVGRMPAKGEGEQEAARVFLWRRRGLRRGW